MTVDQPQTLRQKFNSLKQIDFDILTAQLVVVKKTPIGRKFKYTLNYAPIEEKLERRLHAMMKRKVELANACNEYTLDCEEPEADMVLSMDNSETDFSIINEQLKNLDANTDIIQNVKQLEESSSYLIVLRNINGVVLTGFKALQENWKTKRKKNLISLLFKENELIDLEDTPVFSISRTIDVFSFNDTLFILSKKDFERGLNYREGMKSSAQEFYEDEIVQRLFVNLDSLTQKVGDNIRLMRKVAHVKRLGHYKNEDFLKKLFEVCSNRGWSEIVFSENQIVLSDDNIEVILTVLADKRLVSEITANVYDVNGAKPFGNKN